MSPLMQAIYDYLSECCLKQYLDLSQWNACAGDLDRLYTDLSGVLPEAQRETLQEFADTLSHQLFLESEAMFLAAFAAGKELA